MVLVQCNSAVHLRLRPNLLLPLLNSPSPHSAPAAASFPKNHHLHLFCPRRHRRIISAAASPAGFPTPDPTSKSQNQSQIRTLFPGGFKRPEIKVPTLVLRVGAEEVVEREGLRATIDTAVARRVVGIVLLERGVGDGADRRLYEAACALKSLLRERAYLVIDDRVDIAAAVGASGVLLSDQGIPAIVARNMLSNSGSDSVLLPLVARNVKNIDAALSASRSEGADFLIVDTDIEKYADILEILTVHQDIKIPVFLNVSGSIGGDLLTTLTEKFIQSGASGIVFSLNNLRSLSEDVMRVFFPSEHAVNGRVSNVSMNSDNYETYNTRTTNRRKMVAGFNKLDDKEIQFIEKERNALLEAVAVIRKAAPMMEEVSLLIDAISRLDQPFMLVTVGEFNSGKSTVINALLGRRYLREGVVPTTNEITLLCYSDTDDFEQERCERHPDGQFVCYLPSPMLKEMNLVDTPGTNVILQRQQRLTEEFVPRADLVLFVLSSDRPLTESEVAFLLYIRQWKKKIFFALNKSDLYRNTSELEEAMAFIKQNIRKLLNTEQVKLFPLSARLGLEAKLSITSNTHRDRYILNDPLWQSSGFDEFENFLYSFLDGSTDNGKERMRLKLETPIGIADRLLAASERLVSEEYALACKDLTSIDILINSVNDYAKRMENDSITWRKQISSLVETAKSRSVKLVESILQLSNVDLITTYAIRGEKATSAPAITAIQNEIIGPAQSDAQKLLEEYVQWLETSFSQESNFYCQSFDERWPEFIIPQGKILQETTILWDKGNKFSLEVTQNFSAKAAARLIEQEIREAVLGTYGGLGVAGLSASLLTSVLPTTLEDLLALALCSTGGLLAVSNFPTRRRNAVEKVTKIADALSQQIEQAMREDLLQATEKLVNFVEVFGRPYQEAAQQKIKRLSEIKNDLIVVEQKLEALKTEIQNLHVA